jgi:Fe-S oxidoreductase
MEVARFVPRFVDLMCQSTGFAAIRLLAVSGCEISVPPGQTCCEMYKHQQERSKA